MAKQTPETQYFGLTRIGNGEALSKNGWSFTSEDRVTIDKLFHAMLNHTHTGDPALGNPTNPPTMTALPTGGTLPAATTFYYRASFVDQWGLETAASPEASVTTPNPVGPPTAPAVVVETTLGTVSVGVYSYLISYVDLYGGETTPSPMGSVQVTSGTTNRIRLNLPDLPSGIASINIYRSRPGQTYFYRLGNSTTTTFYDSGSTEDQTITAPTVNTTNSQNSIQVTIPAGFIPQGCFGWKIYRALSSGGYDGNSLVHWVTEGASDTSTTPRIMWTDTGDSLLAGFPPGANSSATTGIQLTMDQISGALPLGQLPRGAQVYSTFVPGTVTDQTVVGITEFPILLQPTRLTAYFKTPPGVSDTVHIQCLDTATPTPNKVELICNAANHLAGDPAGYYHLEWPLYLAETFEAENGTRSNPSTVAIASDVAASSGQAVALATLNDYVQVDLGPLDSGQYQTFFTARVLQFAASSTNDLAVQVIRTDTAQVLGSAVSYTLASGGSPDPTLYVERNGPVFTAPGGVDLVLRVSKATSTTQAYNIDKMRFTATAPILGAGMITTKTLADGGTTTAADVNISLWF
jgi:hypothetical protein